MFYSETFSIKTKPNPSNVSYTAKTLGLHSDLPGLNYAPGVSSLMKCFQNHSCDSCDMNCVK